MTSSSAKVMQGLRRDLRVVRDLVTTTAGNVEGLGEAVERLEDHVVELRAEMREVHTRLRHDMDRRADAGRVDALEARVAALEAGRMGGM